MTTERHLEISEDDFIERFQPEQDKDGSYFVHRDWTNKRDLKLIEQARAERRLWTQMSCDEGVGCFFGSGYHWVNREAYIICAVPTEKGTEYSTIPDARDDDLEHCDRCGEELEPSQIGLCDECQDLDKEISQ